MTDRIQKIIAQSGFCSRRKAEELIRQGKVLVNDKPIKLGDKAEIGKDTITIDGKPIQAERKRYLIFNKPLYYTTTLSDPFEKKIISQLIRVPERVFPIGRLDKNSAGLLLLTNDGDFANRILHPRYEIKKTYYLVLEKAIVSDEVMVLEKGIVVEGEKTAPAKIKIISENELEITIHEGKKHQVKNMFKAIGYKVLSLVRVRIGKLNLGDLKPGKYRDMTDKEKELVLE